MKKYVISILVCLCALLFCALPAAAAASPEDMELAIAWYTNQYRISQGLPELDYRSDYQYAADIRAQELLESFSHVRPNGDVTPLGLFSGYYFGGENICFNYTTAQEMLQGWIASEGHRKNIIATYQTGIVVGVARHPSTGSIYAVQIFITKETPSGFTPPAQPPLELTGGFSAGFSVKDANGDPLKDASITAINSAGQQFNLTTGWQGAASNIYLTNGNATITISKPGYITGTWTINLTPAWVSAFPHGTMQREFVLIKESTPEPSASPAPTQQPTAAPTAKPTPAPTATVQPTATPSPTATPTAMPKPTSMPTPTVEPTATPTVKPTAKPTATPIVKPTATPKPTAAPTPVPTAMPKPNYSKDVNGFVTRLYNICLNRTPDAAGLADWAGKLSSKSISGADAAMGFIFSKEFKDNNYCNECYVKTLYNAFFGREADNGGLTDWVGRLEGGTTREEVFNGFVGSAEFSKLCADYGIIRGNGINVLRFGTVPTGNCVNDGTVDGVTSFVTRMYQVALNRTPDAAGLKDWTNRLWNHTASGRDIGSGFIFSAEFQNRNYSNADYVERLYQSFMGRASDAPGKADWVNQLNNGASREYVFNGFANSNEFTNICNSYGILKG